ncbi:acetoacetate--CoA ligase [Chromobacterium violaceum]|uniref:Acetoacetyl-CoA synthetase n=2 Tax=Chromobacterium violaceum TaxID=536 RepID=A0A202B8X2_CHRVL|nr:acetoacetate--CoA ligase [Chromobacterium violaceum]AAQ59432.1 probable acetyl-coenzyme A synthetase [Chromobacterium violaceum ATCC 12472]MBA8735109.1 acetoacetate--CoA ligase [Chromobacterium violaceum]MBX9265594.1 acetoacetate--CoA ligase [Chromobacterium violaceum]MCD0493130.1 acetoacetate--CoA ligase [Chromobacterium violaceum]OQS51137.1 acetoacetyl-CoA synthetase [Chromobacterium violaceum]
MQARVTPIWSPSAERLAGCHLTAFARLAETVWGKELPDYHRLWRASVEDPGRFWSLVWDYCGVIGDKGAVALENGDDMLAARFFPEARLNFAENLLRRDDDALAVVFRGEDKIEQKLSWHELNQLVSRLQQAMRAAGIQPGDRVAGFMPNMPATLAAMLAASSLGAVWTSGSPDFGTDGALDRFGQTEPRILFCPDGYWYNGKAVDIRAKMIHLAEKLPSVERFVVVPYLGDGADFAAAVPRAQTLDAFLAGFDARPVEYLRLPFNHPLYILYSSGTTGKPKCIVHGAGGTLLQHLKEHQLHADVHAGDHLFYFTTCGWMMWNWLVSGLASGAALMLYDGSPFADEGRVLWDYAAEHGFTHFGTSAKYIDSLKKTPIVPARDWQLPKLRSLFSTGSPLVAESYDWVYENIKSDLNLASISGGTDIVSCFALGAATLPVYRGELQCRGLGMAVDIYDELGRPLYREKGELVCLKPFPSMPIGFWNDPDGEKYRQAYFGRFPNIWCHGDYAEVTQHDGVIIYGRSDAVLNPGGVRIGTAEIYRQVEVFPEVLESLAVGQTWQDDERVVLFVKLREGVQLDEDLSSRIKAQIKNGASPRHVPARIVAVADIPRTVSGKIVELAVKNIIHGRPVSNVSALANPEALKLFENLSELGE